MALLYAQFLLVEQLENEEDRNRPRIFRRMVRDMQDPFRIPNSEFRKNFRLNKEACLDLIEALSPHLTDPVIASKLPKRLRVLATIHFLATGSYQRSSGSNNLVCMSQPMVSRCLREVTTAILRYILKKWIKFPRNDAEKNLLKRRFTDQHEMPHVIGVVDGTHVAIVTPRDNEHIYVNRKGYHSLNCQIVCDATSRIFNMVARWPGSTHDAYIWRTSRIGQAMRANYENGDTETRVMGDSGYPCLPWLIVPLRNAVTQQEVHYNTTFVQCRSLVERCIGLLKGRFRCLLRDRTLHYSPHVAARIVLSCAVLHNIALHYRVEDPEPMWDEIDLEDLPQPQMANGNERDVQFRRIGQERRRQYINEHF